MTQFRSRRIFRLSFSLLLLALPVLVVLAVQMAPDAHIARAAPPADYRGSTTSNYRLVAPLTVSETQTAAASQTSLAETIAAINLNNTQTAVARTETAVATQQTAIAATQTAAAEPSSTAVFRDNYEPNDDFNSAFTVAAGANATCAITLWPVGDVDYFRFVGKAGSAYEVFTLNVDPGLDTVLTVYDSEGRFIDENDDFQFGTRASKVIFSVGVNGYYYFKVINRSADDPINKRYCVQVKEIQGTATNTPLPSATRVPGADVCEPNNTYDTACLVGVGETLSLNFVPLLGEERDTDIFRLWVKAGLLYTCETFNLSGVNDTNIIFASGPSREQWFAGNDDKAPGDLGSELSYFATYTGWLYILVGPVPSLEYPNTAEYTYQFTCESVAATLTPLPTHTPTPRPPSTGGGGGVVPPVRTSTFTPTPDQLPTAAVAATDTPRPNVIINPLPTDAPTSQPGQSLNVNVTLYYDSNRNFTPELDEGIMDVAVALYDNATGQLLSFGYTNEAGNIRFPVVTQGAARVVVPFLNFSQVVANGDADILLRVAPQPLPGGIP